MTEKRIPDSPPVIQPVDSSGDRPRWSVMIPIYNNANFLRETLESVLAQDPGKDNMQIEVVDDCSNDADIKAMVEEIGKGRVSYYSQDRNVGSLRNFETCLNRAQGYLIHLLHSDDVVKQGFYATLESLFDKYPQAGAAFSNYTAISEDGKILYESDVLAKTETLLENFLYTIAYKCPIQYVTIAVKREVYEVCGGFYGMEYGEDWEMWGRIAKKYPIAYSPQSLAKYRVHMKSISGRSAVTGQNLRDISKVINTISTYLPKEEQSKAKQKARRHYAWYALGFAEYVWHVTRNKQALYAQVTGALKMYMDFRMIRKAAKLYSKLILQPLIDRIKKRSGD